MTRADGERCDSGGVKQTPCSIYRWVLKALAGEAARSRSPTVSSRQAVRQKKQQFKLARGIISFEL